jgi:tight adherence protein B
VIGPLGLVGAVLTAVALGVVCYLAIARPVRVPVERRRAGSDSQPSLLSSAADAVSGAAGRLLQRSGTTRVAVLETAGVTMSAQDLAVVLVAGTLAAGALGLVLGGPLLAVVLAAAVPLGARVGLGVRTRRRRAAFADQLDDSLQLLASSLRAGHSLLQALASVARETEAPSSEEYSRVINATRVGRELGDALAETAARTANQDFAWVAQAIAINREVGGNLAEVLDRVGITIRERNQLRRQVKALSAEGRLSAVVLMALPVGILGFLTMTNPGYIGLLTGTPLGIAMLVVAALLMVGGGFWLRSVVRIRF